MSSILDPIECRAGAIPPEQRLFLGVILNAVIDATGNTRSRDREARVAQDRDAALTWFQNANADFHAVCNLAGLEPDSVRAGVLAYVDRVTIAPAEAIAFRRYRVPSERETVQPRRVTISDVAGLAGVSNTTVTNALAGKPNASPATRERVRAAARELGYQPTLTRRGGSSVH